MRKMHRDYTIDQRLQALAVLDSNGGNASQTARQLGIPRTTIQRWAAGVGVPDTEEGRQWLEAERQGLADRFESHARRAMRLAAERLEDASYFDLVRGAAIAVDKMRLLREQPTSISSAESVEEKRRRLAELLAAPMVEREYPDPE